MCGGSWGNLKSRGRGYERKSALWTGLDSVGLTRYNETTTRMTTRGVTQVCLKKICFHLRRKERAFLRFECGRKDESLPLDAPDCTKAVSDPSPRRRHHERPGRTDADDAGRCKVESAGALVSPLISAPKLELALRSLPIFALDTVGTYKSSTFTSSRRSCPWHASAHHCDLTRANQFLKPEPERGLAATIWPLI